MEQVKKQLLDLKLNIQVITLNINGLTLLIKRQRMINWKNQTQVYFVQDYQLKNGQRMYIAILPKKVYK